MIDYVGYVLDKISILEDGYKLLGERVICSDYMPKLALDEYKKVLEKKRHDLIEVNYYLEEVHKRDMNPLLMIYIERTVTRIEYEMTLLCLEFIDKPFNSEKKTMFDNKLDEIYNEKIKETIILDVNRLMLLNEKPDK